jgi:hypothetical protein
MFRTYTVGMFITYPYTKSHISSFSGSEVISMKRISTGNTDFARSPHSCTNLATLWRQNPKAHQRTHNSPPPAVYVANWIHSTPPANLPEIHSDPILPSTSRSSEWCLSFVLSHQNLYTFLSSPMRVTCPADLILFGLMCLIIFGDEAHSFTKFCKATASPRASDFWNIC